MAVNPHYLMVSMGHPGVKADGICPKMGEPSRIDVMKRLTCSPPQVDRGSKRMLGKSKTVFPGQSRGLPLRGHPRG